MTRASALVAAALLAATACGTARRGEPLVGALALRGEPERGETVFMQHCHSCHPGGESGLGPALNNKPLPGFAMKTQVRWGVGAMPAFSDDEIPPDDLDALVAYLHALRDHP